MQKPKGWEEKRRLRERIERVKMKGTNWEGRGEEESKGGKTGKGKEEDDGMGKREAKGKSEVKLKVTN